MSAESSPAPPETKDNASSASADNEFDFDLVVLGAGSGGTRAARWAASQYGARVACVELPFGFVPSDEVGGAGGTCVIRGCVPKKLLVYASAFSEEFRDARGFGWSSSPPPFDWRALIDRKGREVERLNAVYNRLLTSAGVNLFEGRASLEGPHKVRVEMFSSCKEDGGGGEKKTTTKLLTARHVLVATGGSAVKAPIPGADELAITSDDALVLEDLPLPRANGAPPRGPVVLVGAGYIALEFAGIFAGLGCDVRVLYRKDLPLAGFDGDCRRHVAECMEGRGVAMMAGTSPTKLVRSSKNPATADKNLRPLVDVHYRNPDGSPGCIEGAALVMFGTGRRPNSRGLGLEEAGVDVDERTGAIKVDAFSRTTAPGVWAIGDVTDRMALTPVALMEAMAFCESAFGAGGRLKKPDYDRVPTACFVQPPLAACGLTEEEAAARVEAAAKDGNGNGNGGGDKASPSFDVFVSKFRPMRNTLSGRNESTFMKMIVDAATDEVVGCHMVGPDAPEIMQGIAVAMRCRARKADFDGTVGIHPSAAEEFVTMRTRTRKVGGK